MKKVMMIAMAAATMLLAGCGEKKCFFFSHDSKAVAKGARVIWRNSDAADGFDSVGRVASVEETEDGTKITIEIKEKFNTQIYDDVAARVELDEKISPPRPFVLMVKGKNTKRPLLANGDEIREAAKPKSNGADKFNDFLYWLKTSQPIHIQMVLGILILVTTIIKLIMKSLKLGAIIAIICAIGYVCVTVHIDWNRYRERFANTQELAQDVKGWLQQHAEKVHSILQAGLDVDD